MPLASMASLRADFERDGVVFIRNAIPQDQVTTLRQALEEVFARENSESIGFRTDMTAAAEELDRAGKGDKLLKDKAEGGVAMGNGKFLTEIEAGRFHRGVRDFEHKSALPGIIGELLNTKDLRFFGDHIFLKEPGSELQTSFHQDLPYFTWEGDQAAVCWVPVDKVSKSSGAMRYVKGSHKWAQYAPRLLISNDKVQDDLDASVPELPADLEQTHAHEILSWDCEPGDVIVHHPNTVHGSVGNVSTNQRRLAASIRYIGDDVRWKNKPTTKNLGENLWHKWKASRNFGMEDPKALMMLKERERQGQLASLPDDMMYAIAIGLAEVDMKDGDPFDTYESSRRAYPIVWQSARARL
eukprot:gnl/TRDRNA2_/TRDRNA2_28289_c0_seq1.p1 gnl/TRDRNA2_/TRDRNA2_28289_c0~~gnl/TRDRNA2_/TRDRNA2_28289_c0_seq1.p1  ORF type:complete len:355 (+),score=79.50 gnl/TRDRNA2_/TRDRNA2_28289_c0_seq1:51-1115(+)